MGGGGGGRGEGDGGWGRKGIVQELTLTLSIQKFQLLQSELILEQFFFSQRMRGGHQTSSSYDSQN